MYVRMNARVYAFMYLCMCDVSQHLYSALYITHKGALARLLKNNQTENISRNVTDTSGRLFQRDVTERLLSL